MARVSWFVFGFLLLCFSLAQMVPIAHLGVNPWVNFYDAMSQTVGFLPGTWDFVLSIVIFGLMMLLTRFRYIGLNTIVSIFGGLLINFFLLNEWVIVPQNYVQAWLIFLITSVTCAIGGGLINIMGLGYSLRTGLVVMFSERWGISFLRIKLAIECGLLIISFLLLSKIVFGTILIYLIDSYVMNIMMTHVKSYFQGRLKIKNES